MVASRRRIATAAILVEEDPSTAVSAAYYAMLDGVRAALSEQDVHVRTHRGAWHEFHTRFVEPGLFDRDLATAAHAFAPEREQADHDAWEAPEEEARRAVATAERFVATLEALLA